MSKDRELIRRGADVFRDFGYPDADLRQTEAMVAAEIIKVLDGQGPPTWRAQARTRMAHAKFSHIRNVKLARFTCDRLLTILDKLGQHVELSVTVMPRLKSDAPVPRHP